MASWVCNQDGTVFTVYAPRCPECGAQDAYEQGGDPDVNVYDVAAGQEEVDERLGLIPPSAEESVADTPIPTQKKRS